MGRVQKSPLRDRIVGGCAFFAMLACSPALAAQDLHLPAMPADEFVRRAVANEVAANNETIKHMFRSDKQTPKGLQTRLYVETNDAMAGMLISVNGHPLTPQQEQAEKDHLNWLVNNPDQLRKKRTREKEDADRSLRIVRALPDAFHYEYDGMVNPERGMGAGAPLVRVRFTPNSSYSPPSRVEQVLTGMKGYLLIDSSARRIARIDGTLFRDVTFGWGIFGRLDKGGSFVVRQADEGNGSWEITEMRLNITGTILLFKSLSMVSDEVLTDFQRVPDNLPFVQGVKLLEAEQEKLALASH